MANPACQSEDGNAAVFVGTMLETGDGFTLCNDCLVGWCAAMLTVMTGVDAAPFLAAISEDVATPDAPASAEGEAGAAEVAPNADPPAPAGRARGKSPAASSAADEEGPPVPESPADGDAATPGA